MSPTPTHWQDVYLRKDAQQVSWFRPRLDASLALLLSAGAQATSRVIDIGGGASTLVDDLLGMGLTDVTVLDLSDEALSVARARLAGKADAVRWWVSDLLKAEFQQARYDLWHDRAVLHFLIDARDARRYAQRAARAIAPGGHAVIGGFAPRGPQRCSGLQVARRSAQDIAGLLAPAFELVEEREERHTTPADQVQLFAYALLRRR